MDDFDKEFLEAFREEAEEMVNLWEEGTLKLEESVDAETLHSLFRTAHTLKSSFRAVDITRLADFVHNIESIIKEVQVGFAFLNIILIIFYAATYLIKLTAY